MMAGLEYCIIRINLYHVDGTSGEGGLEHIIIFNWFGKLAHEKAMRSMELFAREVMPRFQEPAVQAATGWPDTRICSLWPDNE